MKINDAEFNHFTLAHCRVEARALSWEPVVALAGSLPRAATDDETVEVWERVFDAPSPEDAILDMIDARRCARRR